MLYLFFQEIQIAPEYWCWRSVPELVEIHRIGNLVTFAAYLALGLGLLALAARLVPLGTERTIAAVYLTIKRNPYTVIAFLFLFGLFILMCGIGHFGDYWVVEHSTFFGWRAFFALGWWKVATAIVSAATAVGFAPLGIQLFAVAGEKSGMAETDSASKVKGIIDDCA